MPPKSSRKSGLTYWLYGIHAVQAALSNPDRQIRRVCATRAGAEKLETGARRVELVEAVQLDKWLPKEAVHQGVALEVEPLDSPPLEQIMANKQTLVILDQVTDPHNIGAILRSAAAFDVAAVILPRNHAAGESAVLAKAASGALELVPLVMVTNIAHTIEQLKAGGYWIAGLDAAGQKTVAALGEYLPLCVVMGAEGKGLRRLTAERCDVLVQIAMSPRMESLNVSNAAAIALYAAHSAPK